MPALPFAFATAPPLPPTDTTQSPSTTASTPSTSSSTSSSVPVPSTYFEPSFMDPSSYTVPSSFACDRRCSTVIAVFLTITILLGVALLWWWWKRSYQAHPAAGRRGGRNGRGRRRTFGYGELQETAARGNGNGWWFGREEGRRSKGGEGVGENEGKKKKTWRGMLGARTERRREVGDGGMEGTRAAGQE